MSIIGGPSAAYEELRDRGEEMLPSESATPAMTMRVTQNHLSSRVHVTVEDLTLFVQVWAMSRDVALTIARHLSPA